MLCGEGEAAAGAVLLWARSKSSQRRSRLGDGFLHSDTILERQLQPHLITASNWIFVWTGPFYHWDIHSYLMHFLRRDTWRFLRCPLEQSPPRNRDVTGHCPTTATETHHFWMRCAAQEVLNSLEHCQCHRAGCHGFFCKCFCSLSNDCSAQAYLMDGLLSMLMGQGLSSVCGFFCSFMNANDSEGFWEESQAVYLRSKNNINILKCGSNQPSAETVDRLSRKSMVWATSVSSVIDSNCSCCELGCLNPWS